MTVLVIIKLLGTQTIYNDIHKDKLLYSLLLKQFPLLGFTLPFGYQIKLEQTRRLVNFRKKHV